MLVIHQHSADAWPPPPPPPPPQNEDELRLAEQLVHLASQFHASEYCKAKFGHQGSTMAYVPLSIHLPDHFRSLQDRRARSVQPDPWSLHHQSDRLPPPPPPPPPQQLTVSESTVSLSASRTLPTDLAAAIETPLSEPQPLGPPLKTSATHPLHVSALLPPELLPTLSLHLSVAPDPGPTLFTVHPAFSLERITSFTPPPVPSPPPYYASAAPEPAQTQTPAPAPSALQLWSRAPLKHALSTALASTIRRRAPTVAALDSTDPDSDLDCAPPPPGPRLPPLALGDADLLSSILARVGALDDLARPGARSRMPHDRTFSAPPAVFKALLSSSSSPWSLSRALSSPTPSNPRLPPPPAAPIHPPTLGNLLLSSCPGKKVRLEGPVNGRAGVRRDLNTDMARLASLGVRCVVCCLDDEELSLLGVPWPSYAAAARAARLDVLRVPMPEGLAPGSPAEFDRLLKGLLEGYTLRGAHVLVHCRGGVGRAGLVGCCWALRLGLCGSLPPKREGVVVGEKAGASRGVERDTLDLVERAIGAMRRRRSLKAIETYEQVRFLVDYVEFLRAL